MFCDNCTHTGIEFAFEKNGYRILHCKSCDHLFTDYKGDLERANQIYSDEYFFEGGHGYPNYTLDMNLLVRRGEYYAKLLQQFMPPGRVLDVGAAAGFLLKGFENKGWNGWGIEPNQTMVDFGHNLIGANLIQGTLESVQIDKKYDLVLLIQVVAHLYNLKFCLSKIKDFLNPGGYILIETWNKDSLTARAFGHNWHEFSPPTTLHYFSKKTLHELMELFKFSFVASGRPRKDINSRHAKALLIHKFKEMKGLKWMANVTSLLPGNLSIPYPAEDLFWALYQKSN
jgi:2-polyprenyl-3-methyl-5-hydroxy-6-metoxy-1,4-benzoquinol methylase